MSTRIENDVTGWIDAALDAARPHEAVVIVDEATEINLRWANNSLTTNGQMHERSITVHVFAEVDEGTASGTVTAPLTADTQIADVVAAATRAAVGGEANSEAAPLVSGPQDADFADPAAPASIEQLAGFAAGLGQLFDGYRERGDLLFGFAESVLSTTWVATSAGARRRHVQPRDRVEINAKRPATKASVWVGRPSIDVDVATLGDELTARLEWSANRIDLPAGRYETLLPPGAVADLLIPAYWRMSAKDAAEGRSVWSKAGSTETRIGERLAPLPLTLASDPAAAGIEQAPFAIVHGNVSGEMSVFDNAAPVEAVDLISDGVLAQLIRTRGYAAKTDADFVFPTENLIVSAGGSATLGEMIAGTERGLLLTCLWYLREVEAETLLTTGLTRDGVFLIEDGRVVGAVNNFRFNESPVDLLRRVTEVGASELTLCREWNDFFPHTITPPMRVRDFNMSTVSAAT